MRHPNDLHVNSLISDRWDVADFESTINDIISLGERRWNFSEVIPSGDPLFQDVFISLLRSLPKLRDKNEMRPSHAINHWLLDVAMKLPAFEQLRNESTVGDAYASATGLVPISEMILEIYRSLDELPQKFTDLDEKMSVSPANENLSDEYKHEKNDDQNDTHEPDSNVEEFQQEYEALQEELEQQRPGAAVYLSKAMDKANEQIIEEKDNARAWGLEAGELIKLPLQERLTLATRIKGNSHLKKIADLIGAMKPLSFAALRKSVQHGAIEISSVDRSGDLARVLPSELAKVMLKEPLRTLALSDLINETMLSYKVAEKYKEARGGMIVCRDSSSSMKGDPDAWAAALGGTLLLTAREQKRPFRGIVFGSKKEIKVFDFPTTESITPEAVIDWVSFAFMGGTDFQGPLSLGLDWLVEDYAARTTCRSDLVFITDGRCSVGGDFQENFLSELKRVDGRCYGLAIGVSKTSQPLYSLCDGKVWAVRDLKSGRDLTQLFEDVA